MNYSITIRNFISVAWEITTLTGATKLNQHREKVLKKPRVYRDQLKYS